MSDRALHPVNVAAGAVLVGGVLIVALPQHVLAVVQVVLVTIAASAGLHALSVHVPPTGWLSPFRWWSPFASNTEPVPESGVVAELEGLRRRISGRRQSISGDRRLPPDILRALRPMIAAALDAGDREGATTLDPPDRVGPTTLAVLGSEPIAPPYWLRTSRGDAAKVAEAIHAVLDDLARLGVTTADPRPDIDPHHRETT